MHILFFVILLLCFCFRSFSIDRNTLNVGKSCESSIQETQNYIRDVLKKHPKPQLPSDFNKRINSWNSYEARKFLDILSEKIGSDQIVSFLQKRSSFFINISFEDFIERLNFYEQYIGKEFFDKQLAVPSHWLSIFNRNSLKKTQKVIEVMEEVFGKEQTLRILRNDIRFAINNVSSEIRPVYEFMGKLFGEEFTKNLMENHGYSFSRLRKNRIEAVLKILMNDIGLDKEDIKELSLTYLFELAEVQPGHLKSLMKVLVPYMGVEKVRSIIRHSFTVVYGIYKKDIESIVKFLEKYLEKEEIIKKLESSVSGLRYIDRATLEALEKEWGEDKMRENLTKYGLRNPVFQKKASTNKEQEPLPTPTRLDSLGLHVDFLDEYLNHGEWGVWMRQHIDIAYNQSIMQKLEQAVTEMKDILTQDEIKEMIMTDYKKFIAWTEAFFKFHPYVDKKRWINLFQSKSIGQLKQISVLPDIIKRYIGKTNLNVILQNYGENILDIDLEEFQSLISKIESRSGREGVSTILYERFHIFL